jgi:glycosyltransferase involved in cell wall biosynthesis
MTATREPSVVFLDHCSRVSGGEIALLRLIPGLQKYRAHVILAEEGPMKSRFEDAGISVEVLPLDPQTLNTSRERLGRGPSVRQVGASLSYAFRLRRRLRELDPSVVHANSLKSGYYGVAAARLAGVPLIWHVRDRLATDYMPDLACRMTRSVVRLGAHGVIANSQVTLGTLGTSRSGQPREVVYDPYRRDRPPVRTPGDRSTVTIGLVGRISPWKGQDVFLRAMAELRPTVPGLRARVIGDAMFDETEYAAGLKELASGLGLEDILEWRGFRSDVESELAELDVLVHCSTIPEPFGMVVVEGMAAGLPVIASSIGGPTEVIQDGEDGMLVAPNDPGAMAAAILLLLTGDTAARLGDAAQQSALRFAPELAGAQVEELYDRLVR